MDSEAKPPTTDVSPVAARILAIDAEIAAMERTKPKAHVLAIGSVVFPLGVVAVATASYALDLPYLRGWVVLLAVPCILYARQMVRSSRHRKSLEEELDGLIAGPGHATTDQVARDALEVETIQSLRTRKLPET